MKQIALTGLLLFTVFSAPAVHAASCAAANAALSGAQAGYEQDRKAAESWSQREKQANSGFSQCLGDISTSITVPTFPDFSQIFDQIKDKICSAARDKVSSLLPSNIDPWGDLGLGNLPTTNIPLSSRSNLRTQATPSASSSTSPSPATSATTNGSYPFSL
ncbi:hypothetical protein [Hafnia paralvei]|uniref:hypothetical protein n=1 Tax=Hafnia paralvei TaxID=546367 RepID=UPI00103518F9|nr:hypothetical protein [Hafnia paralvei]TBL62597.1 hypothetical protein EYY97_08830 [Hafnia paralvei]